MGLALAEVALAWLASIFVHEQEEKRPIPLFVRCFSLLLSVSSLMLLFDDGSSVREMEIGILTTARAHGGKEAMLSLPFFIEQDWVSAGRVKGLGVPGLQDLGGN